MPLIDTPAILVEMADGTFVDYPLIRHTYFKLPNESKTKLISGLPLPKPGKYYFKNCIFHPGLKEELEKNYNESIFEDCELPWEVGECKQLLVEVVEGKTTFLSSLKAKA